MPRYLFVEAPFRSALAALLGTCFFLCGLAVPCVANTAPEAIVFFNVMPAEDPQTYCTTEITDCSEMATSTSETGLIEFQIFIDPFSYHGEPVNAMAGYMDWPDEWQFIDAVVCRGGTGYVDDWGSSPHAFQLEWSCDPVDDMFLAVTLVFDVGDYGRLSISGPSWLWIGCYPEGFDVVPVSRIWGEAGTECEYTNQPCRWKFLYCEPCLTIDVMRLTAAPGGHAQDATVFRAEHWLEQSCHGLFEVTTGEAWCTAHVEDGPAWYSNILVIDADATNLEPGFHESWVRVHTTGIARCLNVIFEVQESTPAEKTSWGMLRNCYRE
jgi:hypothetical protein